MEVAAQIQLPPEQTVWPFETLPRGVTFLSSTFFFQIEGSGVLKLADGSEVEAFARLGRSHFSLSAMVDDKLRVLASGYALPRSIEGLEQ